MQSSNGGSIDIYTSGSEVPVGNATGQKQQIKSVTPFGSCTVGSASAPACSPGVIVQPSNACYVRFICNPV